MPLRGWKENAWEQEDAQGSVGPGTREEMVSGRRHPPCTRPARTGGAQAGARSRIWPVSVDSGSLGGWDAGAQGEGRKAEACGNVLLHLFSGYNWCCNAMPPARCCRGKQRGIHQGKESSRACFRLLFSVFNGRSV